MTREWFRSVDGLALCRRCHGLTGPPRACRCGRGGSQPPDSFEASGPFLCKCCASVLLDDYSRWTVYYCRWCRPLVRELNQQAGRLLVVYGKHSIVNGSAIHGGDPAGPVKLAAALAQVSAGTKTLNEWVCLRTRTLLRRHGLLNGDDVPVAEYLSAVARGPAPSGQALGNLLKHLAANHGS